MELMKYFSIKLKQILARTISNENRFYNMLMVCGLATALNSLKICYTLSIIGDSDMKVRIKSINEPH